MAVTQRGSTWQAYVKRGGHRWRISVPAKVEAERIERAILKALDAGDEPDLEAIRAAPAEVDPSAITFRQAIDTLHPLLWKQDTRHAQISLFGLNICAGIIGADKALRDINTDDIDRLVVGLHARGNSDASVNRKMSALRMIWRKAKSKGWVTALPDLPYSKEGRGRTGHLSYEEEDALLTTARKIGREDMADFWIFLIDTGARVGEALKMDDKSTAPDGSRVTFRDTKNGDTRTVPLTKRCQDIMRQRKSWPRPWPFKYDECRRTWDRVAALMGKAEDPQWVQHILRHTCASRLAMGDTQVQKMQLWLGHKTLAITQRYTHLMPSALEGTVGALER